MAVNSSQRITTLTQVLSLRPELEYEILKLILLRERYLRRLENLLNHKKASTPKSVIDLNLIGQIDLIRDVTVEVVEKISEWEMSQLDYPKIIYPFNWNGVNYLNKILQDVTFLNNFPDITNWLGFEVNSNPFLVPKLVYDSSFPIDSKSFLIFGVKPTIVDTKSSESLQKKNLIKSPYITPIVNDPNVIPSLSAANKLKKNLRMIRMMKSNEEKQKLDETNKDMYSTILSQQVIERFRSCYAFLIKSGIFAPDVDPIPPILPVIEEDDASEFSAVIDNDNVDESKRKTESEVLHYDFSTTTVTLPSYQDFTNNIDETSVIKTFGNNYNRLKKLQTSDGIDKYIWTPHEIALLQKNIHRRGGELSVITATGTKTQIKAPWRKTKYERIIIELEFMRQQMELYDMTVEDICSRKMDSLNVKDIAEITTIKDMNSKLSIHYNLLKYQYIYYQKVSEDGVITDPAKRAKMKVLKDGGILDKEEKLASQLEYNMALRIQTRVRRILGKRMRKIMMQKYIDASIIIQKYWRKYITEFKMISYSKLTKLAVLVQNLFRCYLAKKLLWKLKNEKLMNHSANAIQRVFRGYLGRNRFQLKKEFLFCIHDIQSILSTSQFYPKHFDYLASEIDSFLKDYTLNLPTMIITILRGVLYILNGDSSEAVTMYSAGNIKQKIVLAYNCSWSSIVLVIRRRNKLLRRIRGLLASISSSSPVPLKLSPDCVNHINCCVPLPSYKYYQNVIRPIRNSRQKQHEFQLYYSNLQSLFQSSAISPTSKECLLKLYQFCFYVKRINELQFLFPSYFEYSHDNWFKTMLKKQYELEKFHVQYLIDTKCKKYLDKKKVTCMTQGKKSGPILAALKKLTETIKVSLNNYDIKKKDYDKYLKEIEVNENQQILINENMERAKKLGYDTIKKELESLQKLAQLSDQQQNSAVIRDVQSELDKRHITYIECQKKVQTLKKALVQKQEIRKFYSLLKLKPIYAVCGKYSEHLGDLLVLQQIYLQFVQEIGGEEYCTKSDLSPEKYEYYEKLRYKVMKFMNKRKDYIKYILKLLSDEFDRFNLFVWNVKQELIAAYSKSWDLPSPVEADYETNENDDCIKREIELLQQTQLNYITDDMKRHFLKAMRSTEFLESGESDKDSITQVLNGDGESLYNSLSLAASDFQEENQKHKTHHDRHNNSRPILLLVDSTIPVSVKEIVIKKLEKLNFCHVDVDQYNTDLLHRLQEAFNQSNNALLVVDKGFNRLSTVKYVNLMKNILYGLIPYPIVVNINQSIRFDHWFSQFRVKKEILKYQSTVTEVENESYFSMASNQEKIEEEEYNCQLVLGKLRQISLFFYQCLAFPSKVAEKKYKCSYFVPDALRENLHTDFKSIYSELQSILKRKYYKDYRVDANNPEGIRFNPLATLIASIGCILSIWDAPVLSWSNRHIHHACQQFLMVSLDEFCDRLYFHKLPKCNEIMLAKLKQIEGFFEFWQEMLASDSFYFPAKFFLANWCLFAISFIRKANKSGGIDPKDVRYSTSKIAGLEYDLDWYIDVCNDNECDSFVGNLIQLSLHKNLVYENNHNQITLVRYYDHDSNGVSSLQLQRLCTYKSTHLYTKIYLHGQKIYICVEEPSSHLVINKRHIDSRKVFPSDKSIASASSSAVQSTFEGRSMLVTMISVAGFMNLFNPTATEVIEGQIKTFEIFQKRLRKADKSRKWFHYLSEWLHIKQHFEGEGFKNKLCIIRSKHLLTSRVGKTNGTNQARMEIMEEIFGELILLVSGVSRISNMPDQVYSENEFRQYQRSNCISTCMEFRIDGAIMHQLLQIADSNAERGSLENSDIYAISRICSDRLQIRPFKGFLDFLYSGELYPYCLNVPVRIGLRMNKGPGRFMGNKYIRLYDSIPLIVSLYECSTDVEIYNVRIIVFSLQTNVSVEYRLSSVERRLLFHPGPHKLLTSPVSTVRASSATITREPQNLSLLDSYLIDYVVSNLRLSYCNCNESTRNLLELNAEPEIPAKFRKNFLFYGDDHYAIAPKVERDFMKDKKAKNQKSFLFGNNSGSRASKMAMKELNIIPDEDCEFEEVEDEGDDENSSQQENSELMQLEMNIVNAIKGNDLSNLNSQQPSLFSQNPDEVGPTSRWNWAVSFNRSISILEDYDGNLIVSMGINLPLHGFYIHVFDTVQFTEAYRFITYDDASKLFKKYTLPFLIDTITGVKMLEIPYEDFLFQLVEELLSCVRITSGLFDNFYTIQLCSPKKFTEEENMSRRNTSFDGESRSRSNTSFDNDNLRDHLNSAASNASINSTTSNVSTVETSSIFIANMLKMNYNFDSAEIRPKIHRHLYIRLIEVKNLLTVSQMKSSNIKSDVKPKSLPRNIVCTIKFNGEELGKTPPMSGTSTRIDLCDVAFNTIISHRLPFRNCLLVIDIYELTNVNGSNNNSSIDSSEVDVASSIWHHLGFISLEDDALEQLFNTGTDRWCTLLNLEDDALMTNRLTQVPGLSRSKSRRKNRFTMRARETFATVNAVAANTGFEIGSIRIQGCTFKSDEVPKEFTPYTLTGTTKVGGDDNSQSTINSDEISWNDDSKAVVDIAEHIQKNIPPVSSTTIEPMTSTVQKLSAIMELDSIKYRNDSTIDSFGDNNAQNSNNVKSEEVEVWEDESNQDTIEDDAKSNKSFMSRIFRYFFPQREKDSKSGYHMRRINRIRHPIRSEDSVEEENQDDRVSSSQKQSSSQLSPRHNSQRPIKTSSSIVDHAGKGSRSVMSSSNIEHSMASEHEHEESELIIFNPVTIQRKSLIALNSYDAPQLDISVISPNSIFSLPSTLSKQSIPESAVVNTSSNLYSDLSTYPLYIMTIPDPEFRTVRIRLVRGIHFPSQITYPTINAIVFVFKWNGIEVGRSKTFHRTVQDDIACFFQEEIDLVISLWKRSMYIGEYELSIECWHSSGSDELKGLLSESRITGNCLLSCLTSQGLSIKRISHRFTNYLYNTSWLDEINRKIESNARPGSIELSKVDKKFAALGSADENRSDDEEIDEEEDNGRVGSEASSNVQNDALQIGSGVRRKSLRHAIATSKSPMSSLISVRNLMGMGNSNANSMVSVRNILSQSKSSNVSPAPSFISVKNGNPAVKSQVSSLISARSIAQSTRQLFNRSVKKSEAKNGGSNISLKWSLSTKKIEKPPDSEFQSDLVPNEERPLLTELTLRKMEKLPLFEQNCELELYFELSGPIDISTGQDNMSMSEEFEQQTAISSDSNVEQQFPVCPKTKLNLEFISIQDLEWLDLSGNTIESITESVLTCVIIFNGHVVYNQVISCDVRSTLAPKTTKEAIESPSVNKMLSSRFLSSKSFKSNSKVQQELSWTPLSNENINLEFKTALELVNCRLELLIFAGDVTASFVEHTNTKPFLGNCVITGSEFTSIFNLSNVDSIFEFSNKFPRKKSHGTISLKGSILPLDSDNIAIDAVADVSLNDFKQQFTTGATIHSFINNREIQYLHIHMQKLFRRVNANPTTQIGRRNSKRQMTTPRRTSSHSGIAPTNKIPRPPSKLKRVSDSSLLLKLFVFGKFIGNCFAKMNQTSVEYTIQNIDGTHSPHWRSCELLSEYCIPNDLTGVFEWPLPFGLEIQPQSIFIEIFAVDLTESLHSLSWTTEKYVGIFPIECRPEENSKDSFYYHVYGRDEHKTTEGDIGPLHSARSNVSVQLPTVLASNVILEYRSWIGPLRNSQQQVSGNDVCCRSLWSTGYKKCCSEVWELLKHIQDHRLKQRLTVKIQDIVEVNAGLLHSLPVIPKPTSRAIVPMSPRTQYPMSPRSELNTPRLDSHSLAEGGAQYTSKPIIPISMSNLETSFVVDIYWNNQWISQYFHRQYPENSELSTWQFEIPYGYHVVECRLELILWNINKQCLGHVILSGTDLVRQLQRTNNNSTVEYPFILESNPLSASSMPKVKLSLICETESLHSTETISTSHIKRNYKIVKLSDSSVAFDEDSIDSTFGNYFASSNEPSLVDLESSVSQGEYYSNKTIGNLGANSLLTASIFSNQLFQSKPNMELSNVDVLVDTNTHREERICWRNRIEPYEFKNHCIGDNIHSSVFASPANRILHTTTINDSKLKAHFSVFHRKSQKTILGSLDTLDRREGKSSKSLPKINVSQDQSNDENYDYRVPTPKSQVVQSEFDDNEDSDEVTSIESEDDRRLPVIVKEFYSEGPGIVQKLYRIEFFANNGQKIGFVEFYHTYDDISDVLGLLGTNRYLHDKTSQGLNAIAGEEGWNMPHIFQYIIENRVTIEMFPARPIKKHSTSGKSSKFTVDCHSNVDDNTSNNHPIENDEDSGDFRFVVKVLRDTNDDEPIVQSKLIARSLSLGSLYRLHESQLQLFDENEEDFKQEMNVLEDDFNIPQNEEASTLSSASMSSSSLISRAPQNNESNESATGVAQSEFVSTVSKPSVEGTSSASVAESQLTFVPAAILFKKDANMTNLKEYQWIRVCSKSRLVSGLRMNIVLLFISSVNEVRLWKDTDRYFRDFGLGVSCLPYIDLIFRCSNLSNIREHPGFNKIVEYKLKGEYLMGYLDSRYPLDLTTRFRRDRFGKFIIDYLMLDFMQSGVLRIELLFDQLMYMTELVAISDETNGVVPTLPKTVEVSKTDNNEDNDAANTHRTFTSEESQPMVFEEVDLLQSPPKSHRTSRFQSTELSSDSDDNESKYDNMKKQQDESWKSNITNEKSFRDSQPQYENETENDAISRQHADSGESTRSYTRLTHSRNQSYVDSRENSVRMEPSDHDESYAPSESQSFKSQNYADEGNDDNYAVDDTDFQPEPELENDEDNNLEADELIGNEDNGNDENGDESFENNDAESFHSGSAKSQVYNNGGDSNSESQNVSFRSAN